MGQNSSARPNGHTRPVQGHNGRQLLNTWKEIAAYTGRAVRTVQRYERDSGLPVHRMRSAGQGSVMAFSDELDTWLNRTQMKEQPYVRPTLLVLDHVIPGTISIRKLVLEVGYFNVLTAYSTEEAYSTAEKFDVDAFVLDHIPGTDTGEEICEAIKERHPEKPIFVVTQGSGAGSSAPQYADFRIPNNDPQDLLMAVLNVFGPPRFI
jgi:hypothetical protein